MKYLIFAVSFFASNLAFADSFLCTTNFKGDHKDHIVNFGTKSEESQNLDLRDTKLKNIEVSISRFTEGYRGKALVITVIHSNGRVIQLESSANGQITLTDDLVGLDRIKVSCRENI